MMPRSQGFVIRLKGDEGNVYFYFAGEETHLVTRRELPLWSPRRMHVFRTKEDAQKVWDKYCKTNKTMARSAIEPLIPEDENPKEPPRLGH